MPLPLVREAVMTTSMITGEEEVEALAVVEVVATIRVLVLEEEGTVVVGDTVPLAEERAVAATAGEVVCDLAMRVVSSSSPTWRGKLAGLN